MRDRFPGAVQNVWLALWATPASQRRARRSLARGSRLRQDGAVLARRGSERFFRLLRQSVHAARACWPHVHVQPPSWLLLRPRARRQDSEAPVVPSAWRAGTMHYLMHCGQAAAERGGHIHDASGDERRQVVRRAVFDSRAPPRVGARTTALSRAADGGREFGPAGAAGQISTRGRWITVWCAYTGAVVLQLVEISGSCPRLY